MKERLQQIKEFVDKYGKVSFHELESVFSDVSSMTLRRDLLRLEENNAVLRVSGGAISVDSVLKAKDADFAERINNNMLPFNRGYIRDKIAQQRWAIILPLKNWYILAEI